MRDAPLVYNNTKFTIIVMPFDKETAVRSMVLNNFPEFDVKFTDPMFALIFLSRSFDKERSLVFSLDSRSVFEYVGIEKVTLRHIESMRYLITPTQSLSDQLYTIQAMLRPETTALQFSEISSALITAKSNFYHSGAFAADDASSGIAEKGLEIRCYDLFVEKNFQRLVGQLTDFIASSAGTQTWIKDGTETQILSQPPCHRHLFLWVFDDDYIIAIRMPEREDNFMENQYRVNAGIEGGRGYLSAINNCMLTKTWNRVFESIPLAKCKNAGVVFFVQGDMIRYICARNVNIFNSDWERGMKGTVIWCDNAGSSWHETKIAPVIECINKPYIADGTRLRDMVQIIADSVDPSLMKTRRKLVVYLGLSVILLKNIYNLQNYFDYKLYCESCMFKHARLMDVLKNWTLYISGQETLRRSRERYRGMKYGVFEMSLNKVIEEDGNTLGDRFVSWQFVPERCMLSAFDSIKASDSLPLNDQPGNYIDLRAGRPTIDTRLSELLLRIDTVCP
jgi:hypothetical protein